MVWPLRRSAAHAASVSSHFTLGKRLAQGGALSAGPGFVPVVVQGRGVGGSEPGATCALIDLRGGRVLRLPVSMPAAQMAELVHALEGLA